MASGLLKCLSLPSKKGSIIHHSSGKPQKQSNLACYLEASKEVTSCIEEMQRQGIYIFCYISPTQRMKISTINFFSLFHSFVSCKFNIGKFKQSGKCWLIHCQWFTYNSAWTSLFSSSKQVLIRAWEVSNWIWNLREELGMEQAGKLKTDCSPNQRFSKCCLQASSICISWM